MKYTKGKCKVSITKGLLPGMNKQIHVLTDFGSSTQTICQLSMRKLKETVANANLITEAFNVTHETGYTPKQLAEQKTELLEALVKAKELIKDWHNTGAGEMGDGLWAIYEDKSPEMQPINKAIKKATE